jgi:hypothetical protein
MTVEECPQLRRGHSISKYARPLRSMAVTPDSKETHMEVAVVTTLFSVSVAAVLFLVSDWIPTH